MIRTKKSLSILSLALIGVLYGVSPASATPLLGSYLASFTVLGASAVTNVPTSIIGENIGVWSNGDANAITGFLSSTGIAVADLEVTGGQVHAGSSGLSGGLDVITTPGGQDVVTILPYAPVNGGKDGNGMVSEPDTLELLLLGMGFIGVGFSLRHGG